MIKLNKNIYSKTAIIQAIQDFHEFLEGNIEEANESYVINLTLKDNDASIKKEFINYCFGLTQNERNSK